MIPDFNKKTIDTLAKRAAFKCSNPDCRVPTVGPNSDPEKSTLIGEAAHIFGARSGSKRYYIDMTDTARAEITNSIWLCRNCHKLIDTDEDRFSSDMLFFWREQHEKYVYMELGNATDTIQYNNQNIKLALFDNYPPLIRRIVIDKPEGWEWSLTAELLRYLNRPLFQSIDDLRGGLYTRPLKYLDSEEVMEWVQIQLAEISNLISPVSNLFNRLTNSWGASGQEGDVEDIHHICNLIRDNLEQMVKHEEQIYFVDVPQEYESVVGLLKNLITSWAEKLAEIPDSLDEVVSLIGTDQEGTVDNPHIIRKTIIFDVPRGWEKKFSRELNKIEKAQQREIYEEYQEDDESSNSWFTLFVWVFLILVLYLVFS